MASVNGLNFSGLASGIDSQKLVEGLLAAGRAQVSVLQTRQKNVGLLRDTFDSLKGQFADLQAKAQRLGRAINGAFDGRTATTSDAALATAAAGSAATPGVYSFKVKSLAQAHQVASVGLPDANAALKTGSFTLRVGTSSATTITVDGSNNTLQGVAQAINAAGSDVSAAVINDGSAQPHRLVLTAKKSGAANTIQIDTSALTGPTGVDLNLSQTIQTASDSEILLGGDGQAISIKNATNKLENFIPGTTVNLVAADLNKTVTLTVANNTQGAKSAITEFVDSFNKIADFLNARTGYDEKAEKGGALLGSSEAATLRDTITRAVGGAVAGVSQKANRLSAFGITFDDKGKLSIDSAKLDKALAGEIEGVALDDVRRAFALAGTSTNTGVSFLNGTNKTQPTTSPIGVKITTAATQASITGAAVGSLEIDGTNNQLALTIGSKSATISLTQQIYASTDALSQEVQGQIDKEFGKGLVTVSAASGALKFTTVNYGSAATVNVTGGNGAANLGVSGLSAAGVDVVGKFLVNGNEETATGNGQVLSGNAGNNKTEGLQVKVALTQAQLVADPNTPEAQLNVTVGLGSQLDRALSPLLDISNGRFKTINESYTRRVNDFQKIIDRQNVLLSARQESLLKRFVAMETAVNRLQTIGSQLGSQLGGLRI